MSRPPFSGQRGHEPRIAATRRRLAELRRGLTPEAWKASEAVYRRQLELHADDLELRRRFAARRQRRVPVHRGHQHMMRALRARADGLLLLLPERHFDKHLRTGENASFAQRLDMAGHLVAQDHGFFQAHGAKAAMQVVVQIRTADSAAGQPDCHLARSGIGAVTGRQAKVTRRVGV